MKGGEYNMKGRTVILSGLTVALVLAATLATQNTYAQSTDDPNSTLIQKLVTKFKLNETDVKAVFDEHHKEMFVKMEEKMNERLDEAVKNGKITAEQKTLIISKMKELQSKKAENLEKMKDLTAEERKTQMQAERESLTAWAKENNIDLSYLKGGFGGRMHMKIKQ